VNSSTKTAAASIAVISGVYAGLFSKVTPY